MGLNRKDIQKYYYLYGVKELIGNGFVDKDFAYRVMAKADIPKEANLAEAYFYLTRSIIDVSSLHDSRLSHNMRTGLAESLSQKIWFMNGDTIANSRDCDNRNWIQRQVADVLFATIGESELAEMALKAPRSFEHLLESTIYGETNLLDYLNDHLDAACGNYYGVSGKFDFNQSNDLLDCVEAISSCADKLKMGATKKLKVKEMGFSKQNERDFE